MLNSDRFLYAFNSIQSCLKKLLCEKKETSFYILVDKASNSNHVVRRLNFTLKEFADLRNAIVHERTDGHVIAEPNNKAVEEIEHIKSLLLDQPKVIPIFQGNVFDLSVGDTIAVAVKTMFEKGYSQVPIYEHGIFKCLLTTNTIARWLGAMVKNDIFSLTETYISEVIKYTENEDNFKFLTRNSTLFDVLERFQEYERKGKRLEAILISNNGKTNEALLGIITIWDLPKIYNILGQL